jgi:hypothetical protein
MPAMFEAESNAVSPSGDNSHSCHPRKADNGPSDGLRQSVRLNPDKLELWKSLVSECEKCTVDQVQRSVARRM